MRDLFREFALAKRRSQREHDRDMEVAWTTAALTRQKELPPLNALVSKVARRHQTVKDHKVQLAKLSEQHGIPLREVSVRNNPMIRLAKAS